METKNQESVEKIGQVLEETLRGDDSTEELTSNNTEVNESPQNQTTSNEVSKSKKNKLIVFSVISILAIALIWYMSSVSKENTYKANLDKAYGLIIELGAGSETICNGYISAWSGAIEDKNFTKQKLAKALKADYNDIVKIPNNSYLAGLDRMDYNTALEMSLKYYTDHGDITSLELSMSLLDITMTKIANPPKKFKEKYDIIVDIYPDVKSYYGQATNPSGSLISFKNEVGGLSSSISKRLDKYKVLN